MKAILMSIKPKWVAKILNKEKTIEIRKTTPKCDLPIDVYIYCTKDHKNGLHWNTKKWVCVNNDTDVLKEVCFNGKVVAKFTLKEIRLAKYQPYVNEASKVANKLTCLTDEELDKYLNKKDGYGWLIDDLEIFDKPREISEFSSRYPKGDIDIGTNCKLHFMRFLTKAPQSYMFIEVDDEETKISLDENRLE